MKKYIYASLSVLSMIQVGCISSNTVKFDANALYQGYDARYVRVSKRGETLQLDPRLFQTTLEKKGWVQTDPIDLNATEGLIALPGKTTGVAARMDVLSPDGASIEMAVRGTEDGVCSTNWTSWQNISAVGEPFTPPGRFVQFRAILTASSPEALPAISCLTLTPEFQAVPSWEGKLTVIKDDVQRPVLSPIDFKYGRPDHPDLVWFRKIAGLDDIVAGKKSDFERLVALNNWIGALPWKPHSPRIRGKDGHYEWDIRKVIEVGADGKLTLHGHCMSYSEAMVAACVAMGYTSARHCAVLGFREATHEVVEVWVPDMGKWVYLDPTMTQYYFDKETRQPLNLLGMHDIVSDSFVPDNKDMVWFSERKSKETRSIVRKVGGKKPIGACTGDYQFGKNTGGDYDWGFYHGYLAAGFVQITPRNDFQEHPEKVPKTFSHYPGYAGYPNWVDSKTPPRKGGENWFTRKRDFYWTLDQATLTLSMGDEPNLSVILGNTMPFFAMYEIALKTSKDMQTRTIPHDEPGRIVWRLNPGVNELLVTPVDEFGKRGISSTVRLKYTP